MCIVTRSYLHSPSFFRLFLGECEERLADAKGRCPGEAGYTPIFRDVPADFADFKRQAAEKKAKQEAEKNK